MNFLHRRDTNIIALIYQLYHTSIKCSVWGLKILKKYLLIMFIALLFIAACGNDNVAKEAKEEAEEQKDVEQEKVVEEEPEEEPKEEPERTITDDELEIWENDDKPYFTNDEFFQGIEDIELDEHFEHVNVHVDLSIRGLDEDDLYDYTNETGKDIQDVIEVNYGVKGIQVYFYSDDELISKQNEHGVWVNNRMSNWDE